jgi:hypothetical protein
LRGSEISAITFSNGDMLQYESFILAITNGVQENLRLMAVVKPLRIITGSKVDKAKSTERCAFAETITLGSKERQSLTERLESFLSVVLITVEKAKRQKRKGLTAAKAGGPTH